LALAVLSCSSTPDGSITIVTGDETDTFSRAPAPVTLIVEKIDQDGNKSEIARAHLPADDVNLGTVSQTDLGAIAVTGIDAAGKVLVHGETLLVQWGALADTTLQVFAQRTGELARMPSGPAAVDATNAAVVVGRYVLATTATTATAIYDLLLLSTLQTAPALPRPAKSIAVVNTSVVAIDEGGATSLDLDSGTTAELGAPAGGNFGEIAGGGTVTATDSSQYVVGGTRGTGGATPRVFLVDPNGKASFSALATAREAACAAWVDGRGLVVVGGAASGAGAELLAPGATNASPLPVPADPVRGCGAVALDGSHVLVVGGTDAAGAVAPTRVLDLGCTTGCTLSPWPLTVPLVRAQAGKLTADAALVVGDDASGATHAFRVTNASADQGGLREIPLKVARRGARLVQTPTNAFAIVGGGTGIEQYLE
jgi:hypothetical protein